MVVSDLMATSSTCLDKKRPSLRSGAQKEEEEEDFENVSLAPVALGPTCPRADKTA